MSILTFCNNHTKKILWGAVFLYIAVFSLFSFWKYTHFLYDGIDLAIFNQVFWNASEGRWFESSIQGHSYLGDHWSLLIPFLVPVYGFAAQFVSNALYYPFVLLFLQTVALAIGAYPVYRIAEYFLKKIPHKNTWALVMAGVYLLNPVVQNSNLFEFHMLVFAVPLLLWTGYFFLKKQIVLFLFFALASLLVREDVSLVVSMFGVLYFFEKYLIYAKLHLGDKGFLKEVWYFFARQASQVSDAQEGVQHLWRAKKKAIVFGILPIVVSSVWFIVAGWGINAFRPSGGYAFWHYYAWTSDTTFLEFVVHFFSLGNSAMTLVLLLTIGMLPLFRSRYLILVLPTFLKIVVLSTGGGLLILQTHHGLLFLPALFIAGSAGLAYVLVNIPRWKKLVLRSTAYFWEMFLYLGKQFPLFFVFVGVFYMAIAVGPFVPFTRAILSPPTTTIPLEAAWQLLERIPRNTAAAASYAYLPHLSSRKQLSSLHYVWQQSFQFGVEPYVLPHETKLILWNTQDTFDYFSNTQPHDSLTQSVQERMTLFHEQLAYFSLVENGNAGTSYLLQKRGAVVLPMENIAISDEKKIVRSARSEALTILSITLDTNIDTQALSEEDSIVLPLYMNIQKNVKVIDPFAWRVRLLDEEGNTLQESLLSAHRYGIPFGLRNDRPEVFINTAVLTVPQNLRDMVHILEITPMRFAVYGAVLKNLLNTQPVVVPGAPFGKPFSGEIRTLLNELQK